MASTLRLMCGRLSKRSSVRTSRGAAPLTASCAPGWPAAPRRGRGRRPMRTYLDQLERENVRLQGEMRDAEIVIAALVAAAGGRVVVSRQKMVDTSTEF